MPTDQLLQSLFVLFNIEEASKSKFAGDFNTRLTRLHMRIEELISGQPDLETGVQAKAFIDNHGTNLRREHMRVGAARLNATGSTDSVRKEVVSELAAA